MMRPANLAWALAVCVQACTAADFVTDSHAQLQLRNFYYDRDFRSGSGQSQAQEWAQGLIFNFTSGFTPGPIGLGLDAVAMLGIKLDSGPGRTGTGILAYDPTSREVDDTYTKAGVALKARLARSELRVGTQQPTLPVALANTMRLFPPLFDGAYLRSQDIDNLTLHLARFDRITYRDSTNREAFAISSPYGRFKGSATSDELWVAGADYRFSERLTARYYHARVTDLYVQDYADIVHLLPLGDDRLKSDVRLFSSREDGAARAGRVDNRTLSTMFTWQHGAHALGAGYLRLWGDTALPYLAGTSVNVNSEGLLVSEFVNPGERSGQLRYDYDFASLGVPGLRAMARYMDGRDVRLPGLTESGREAERSLELSYVIQSGPLRDVAVRVRQSNYQSDFTRDVNELRVNLDYTLKLW